MRIRVRSALGAAVGLALAITLTACASPAVTAPAASVSGSWDDVVAAAKKEGTLTFYSTANDSGNFALIKAFNAQYPDIKVAYTRLPDDAYAARVYQEAKSGINQVDILMGGQPEVFEGDGAIFRPLSTDVLPELANFPSSALRWPWAMVTAQNTYAVAYSTARVSDADVPKTWEDLLSPRWKGKIQYATPVGSATHMGWLDGVRHTFGDDYLKKWGEQDFTLVDSATPGAQAVVAGSGDLAMIVYPSSVSELIAQGAPLKYVIPTPVFVKPNTMGLLKTSPHPNAARVFANFMISKPGLASTCKITLTAVPVPGVDGCIPIPGDAYNVKDVWTAADAKPYLDLVGIEATS